MRVVPALALLVGAGLVYVTGQRVYLIHTGSMTPTAPIGSLVVTTPSRVEVGDVVTVQQSGNRPPLTHRVVARVGAQFQTKGDANRTPDSQLVAPGDVLGKVELTVPYLGYILAPLWAMPSLAWLTLLIAALLYLYPSQQPVEPARKPKQLTQPQ